MPDVRICEMVPRDGLQTLNPQYIIRPGRKLALIDALAAAGLDFIEIGSFVSTRAVPQMANTDDVARHLHVRPGVDYAALVPNLKHYQRFKASGLDTVALFVSASEAYSQFNLKQTIAESKVTAGQVARTAREDGFRLRGHLSACFQDLDGGDSHLDVLADWVYTLIDWGCDHVALSDTKGTTHPLRVRAVLDVVREAVGFDRIAVHFHDSYGQGITNCLTAYECGVRIFDGCVGGIGGTPLKRRSADEPGGGGNIATEELVQLFHAMGIETGIDLDELLQAGRLLADVVRETGDPPPPSKLLRL